MKSDTNQQKTDRCLDLTVLFFAFQLDLCEELAG